LKLRDMRVAQRELLDKITPRIRVYRAATCATMLSIDAL
jgi:hypothetical protein